MNNLQRLDTPDGRYYVLTLKPGHSYSEGGFLLMPSVTTVLSTKPSLRLQMLENEMGKEALENIGRKAALRGTAMHRFLENYLICLQRDGSSDKCLLYTQKKTPNDLLSSGLAQENIAAGRDLFYNFIYEGFLDRIKQVLFTERFTWSVKHLFAGTADFVYLNQEGKIVIADFKSAGGIKDDETIHKYQLQLSAYTIAFEEIYRKKVRHAELWISHPHGVQDVALAGKEMEDCKSEFIELTRAYHSSWDPQKIAEKYYEKS